MASRSRNVDPHVDVYPIRCQLDLRRVSAIGNSTAKHLQQTQTSLEQRSRSRCSEGGATVDGEISANSGKEQ
jgi:hypothetical protein